jgi:hypothetical protein
MSGYPGIDDGHYLYRTGLHTSNHLYCFVKPSPIAFVTCIHLHHEYIRHGLAAGYLFTFPFPCEDNHSFPFYTHNSFLFLFSDHQEPDQ